MTTLLFLENLTAAKFIVAFRKRSAKALSNTATKAFKLILKKIQRFHEKLHFYIFTLMELTLLQFGLIFIYTTTNPIYNKSNENKQAQR